MSSVYIEALDASYSYGKKGFSLVPGTLRLERGKIVFLKGKNGSGKSTWMKLLAGIFKPSQGSIRIDGCDTKRMSLGQIGEKLGYLWQNPQVQLFMETVFQEMTFVDELKGLSKDESEKKAEVWLECFGLSHLKKASVYRLSGGEKQRLALAVILSQGAEYLMLDEPSKNLDEKARKNLVELLKNLRNEKQIGMLIVSHDEAFEQELADETILVEEGKLIERI